MADPRSIEEDTKRIGRLNSESERDWWLRQFERWDMEQPPEEEIAKLIELSVQDVKAGRQ